MAVRIEECCVMHSLQGARERRDVPIVFTLWKIQITLLYTIRNNIFLITFFTALPSDTDKENKRTVRIQSVLFYVRAAQLSQVSVRCPEFDELRYSLKAVVQNHLQAVWESVSHFLPTPGLSRRRLPISLFLETDDKLVGNPTAL